MNTKIFDYGIDQASAALAKHHDKKLHEIALPVDLFNIDAARVAFEDGPC